MTDWIYGHTATAKRPPRGRVVLLIALMLVPRGIAAQETAPPITSAGQRLAEIIDGMDVEHRWLPGQGIHWRTGLPDPKSHQHATHCSAFAAAACDRLGVYLLRPPEHSQTLLANAQYRWLGKEGLFHDWRLIHSRSEAQKLANDGEVVVCLFDNSDPHKPGHAAIVRPSLRSKEDVERDGPDTAMAGRQNHNVIPMRLAFKSHQEEFDAGEILMFAHESPVTRNPRSAREKPTETDENEPVVPVPAPGPSPEPDTPPPPLPEDEEPAAAKAKPPQRTFSDIFTANLRAWTGGTGVVERHRLQSLANNPRIRGEEAAAVATLLHHFRKAPVGSAPAATLEKEGKDTLEHSYRAYVAKLGKINRSLFAGGRPDFEKMHQGPAGDCYLFSGAGWMAHFHPDRLVEMIRPLPNGQFQVRFPDGEQVVVAAPTDTELVYNESSTTVGNGIWMAVLERAVGTLEARHSAKKRAILDPSLRVNTGGSGKFDVHRWTGRPVEALSLHRTPPARVREALIAMQRHHLMAQAVVPRRDPPGPIPGNHVYAVLGFNPETNILTVWNPWGDDFTPKGPEGLQHGWKRHHGVFQIPLADFVRVFSSLDIERR